MALTHWWDPADGGAAEDLAVDIERRVTDLSPGRFRTTEQIVRFFGGLELLELGLVASGGTGRRGPVGGRAAHDRRGGPQALKNR